MTASFDEMRGSGDSGVREPYLSVHQWLATQKIEDLKRKREDAEALFRRTGITFEVYGDDAATERLIPFDIIPRILSAAEWRRLSAGIEQRVRALNAFMYDIYHRQEIIRAGRVPEDLIIQNPAFVPEMMCVEPARGIYSHVIGIDLVRTSESEFFVLEDNTRTPSGVSYMLENREAMMHMFPELFARNRVRAVEDYPDNLRLTLESVAPEGLDREPTVVVLTPGIHNSAYFEHSFLADQMGAELVEGQDLVVVDGALMMKTTLGLKQVDVVYRRIDDAFLDPLVFRRDSVLGVPGIFDVYRAGRLTIVNAPGAGIADDKSIYTYMPDIVEFYTGRPPILKNVPTYVCRKADDLAYVLEHLAELVVKQVHGSGGYGMLVGPNREPRRDRDVPHDGEGAARPLHRPADAGALDLPDAGGAGDRPAPPRPAPLRAGGRSRALHARRPHPRRLARRVAGGQLQPGRRHQGHLGAAGLDGD